MTSLLKPSFSQSITLHLVFGGLLIWTAVHSTVTQKIYPALIAVELRRETSRPHNRAQNGKAQRVSVLKASQLQGKSNAEISSTTRASNQAGISAQGEQVDTDAMGGSQRVTSYTEELRQALDSRKEYPPIARARRQSGRVGVGFTLMKTGRIVNARIITPCGYEKLNEAALATVSKLGTFKPVPDSVSTVDWNVVVPIDFRLN